MGGSLSPSLCFVVKFMLIAEVQFLRSRKIGGNGVKKRSCHLGSNLYEFSHSTAFLDWGHPFNRSRRRPQCQSSNVEQRSSLESIFSPRTTPSASDCGRSAFIWRQWWSWRWDREFVQRQKSPNFIMDEVIDEKRDFLMKGDSRLRYRQVEC